MNVDTADTSLTIETSLEGEPDSVTPKQINTAVAHLLRKAASKIESLDSNCYSVSDLNLRLDLDISNDVEIEIGLYEV